MKEVLTKAVTHREFLKMCGLAIVGAGAGQLVVPPKPASALYQVNDDLYVSGKLGVGTTTPGTVYQFVPSIIEVVAASGNHAGVAISSGALNTVSALNFAKAGTATWEIQSRNELDTPNNRLCFFYNDAGTSREFVTLAASGNVGVGTTSPSAKLHIVGSGLGAHIIIQTDANGQGDIWWQRGLTPVAAIQISPDLEFWSNSSNNWHNRMVIKQDSGNVGIGTTNPDVRLHLDSAGAFKISTQKDCR